MTTLIILKLQYHKECVACSSLCIHVNAGHLIFFLLCCSTRLFMLRFLGVRVLQFLFYYLVIFVLFSVGDALE